MRSTSILKKKEKRKKEKEARPTHGAAVQSRPIDGLDLAGHRHPAQLHHPSLRARPSRGFGVTHVLRGIPDPFRVNFQNLGFSIKSKIIFEALETEFDALKTDFVAIQ